jgi:hypothetical protein
MTGKSMTGIIYLLGAMKQAIANMAGKSQWRDSWLGNHRHPGIFPVSGFHCSKTWARPGKRSQKTMERSTIF